MTNNVYVLDVGKNNWIGSTKEEILSMIEQMFDEGKLPNIDDGFITKIKEINKGNNASVWIGTRPEYELIPADDRDSQTLYLIVDDSQNDYKTKINEISSDVVASDKLNQTTEAIYRGLINGDVEASIATYAEGTSLNANTDIERRLKSAGETEYYSIVPLYISEKDQGGQYPTGELKITVRGKEVICEITIESRSYFNASFNAIGSFRSTSPKMLPKENIKNIFLVWAFRDNYYHEEGTNDIFVNGTIMNEIVNGEINIVWDAEYKEYIGVFEVTANPILEPIWTDDGESLDYPFNGITKPYKLYGIAKWETE